MGFKINVDRFGFAKEPKPEKNSRDYAAELAKSLIDKEVTDRMNEDAVLLGKITAESDAREADKAELQAEIDVKITGEVVARNDAISDAIADEVAARNDVITQEANIRSAKDAQLEEAIRAEQSARELLSREVSDKVGKKGGYGLSRITGGTAYNTVQVAVINEDGTIDSADVQLPGGTLAEHGITNAYTKQDIDDMFGSVGGNSFELMTQEEFNNLQNSNANYDEYEGKAIEALSMAVYYEGLKDHAYRIEVLENQIGDIDSALDEIIALQVAKGGDSE